jgi:hypothetical protein
VKMFWRMLLPALMVGALAACGGAEEPAPSAPAAATATSVPATATPEPEPSPAPTKAPAQEPTAQPTEEAAAEPTEEAAEAAPAVASSTEGEIGALSQTTALGRFGFLISYPEGWVVETYGVTTMIQPTAGTCDRKDGPCIVHDFRDAETMMAMGLPESPVAADVVELNRKFFDWEELSEPEASAAFGSEALGMRYSDDGVFGYILTGVLDKDIWMLNVSAPSEEALEELMPTFEAMLETIQPVE